MKVKYQKLYSLEENERECLFDFLNSYSKFIGEMVIIAYNIDETKDISMSSEEFIKAAETFEHKLIEKLRNKMDISNFNN